MTLNAPSNRIAAAVPGGRRLLALAVAAAFAAPLHAGPTNPTVVSGSAVFNQAGNTLSITNSPGTIINWQGFSISQGEITRFIQQSNLSSVLNRVTGSEQSAILGQLLSNGRVFLINPNAQTITLISDSMILQSGSINAGGGTIVVKPYTSGGQVDLGGADVNLGSAPPGSNKTLGLTSAELALFSAGALVIGDQSAGGDLALSSNITTTIGSLTLNAGGGAINSGAFKLTAPSFDLRGKNGINLKTDVGVLSAYNITAGNIAIVDTGTVNGSQLELDFGVAPLSRAVQNDGSGGTVSITTDKNLLVSNAFGSAGVYATNGNLTLATTAGTINLNAALTAGTGAISLTTAGTTKNINFGGGVTLSGASLTTGFAQYRRRIVNRHRGRQDADHRRQCELDCGRHRRRNHGCRWRPVQPHRRWQGVGGNDAE